MDEIGGTIKKIIDGDTVTAKIRGTLLPVTVHLFGIDAPELDQKWGERSKGYLEHLISETSKSVTFQIVQSNGRRSKVAWMRLQNGFVFNYEAVRLGWAWEKDSGDDELILLQEQAQKHSYGMWADTTKEEPWVWRADQGITEEEDKGVHESTNSAGIGVPRPIADP
jgi:endonuclease YncB( thermonuclease family)